MLDGPEILEISLNSVVVTSITSIIDGIGILEPPSSPPR